MTEPSMTPLPPQRTQQRPWLIVLEAVLACAALFALWFFWLRPAPAPPALVTQPIQGQVETTKTVFFRTPGGLLEVAGLKKEEEFHKDIHSWRGHTAVSVRLEATYRYSIELPPQLRVTIHGNIAQVIVPNYQPELPVAFDTQSVREQTSEGWMRFDGKTVLQELKKDLSTQLNEKAASQVYMLLQREPARQTLKEFISRHIIQDKQWLESPNRFLEVKFQDEVAADKPS